MPSTNKDQEAIARPNYSRAAELKWLAVLAALLIATVLDGVNIAVSSTP